MPRQYDVQGPKHFRNWAIGLCLLGLWCVRDGWFPAESVLAKHPLSDTAFYAFNRSLALLSLSAAAVCAYIHRVVR